MVVLASGSAARRAMLKAAGVECAFDASDIDEAALKASCRRRGMTAGQTANALAEAKAIEAQSRHPGRIVLGADQMLECDGEWFDKPGDRSIAAWQIARLSGRTHQLFSAVVAFRDGERLWGVIGEAQLTMRPLTGALVDAYLDRVGDAAFGSVGGYQIEGFGIQLFEDIRGDHFTILGLPLLPLLAFLRSMGAVSS
jgi:septum formation protein